MTIATTGDVWAQPIPRPPPRPSVACARAKNKQLELDTAENRIRADRRDGEQMSGQEHIVGKAKGGSNGSNQQPGFGSTRLLARGRPPHFQNVPFSSRTFGPPYFQNVSFCGTFRPRAAFQECPTTRMSRFPGHSKMSHSPGQWDSPEKRAALSHLNSNRARRANSTAPPPATCSGRSRPRRCRCSDRSTAC